MSMRALNFTQDISSTYCSYKCILSSVAQSLNVSGNMSIRAISVALDVWNSFVIFARTLRLHAHTVISNRATEACGRDNNREKWRLHNISAVLPKRNLPVRD